MKRYDSYMKPTHYGQHIPSTNNDKNENTATVATVVAICLGTAFFILAIAAVICYIYRRKSSEQDNHKTLLLKRNIQENKALSFKKSSAVRSAGTGSILLKKSPSPTQPKTSQFENCKPVDQEKSKEEKDIVINVDKQEINCITDKKYEVDNEDKENELKVEKESHFGKLHFKLKYNYEKRALCITIIKCCDLPQKDPNFGSCDPYVKLQFLPEKQHKVKTRVMRKTQNPVYDEDFTFFGIHPNQLQTIILHFLILSFDRYSRDDVIGEVFCHLNLLEFDSLEKQICLIKDISPRSHKIRLQGRGEILISLCYQPAANRLTVVILKARNLPKIDLNGLSDPYVKIYLLYKNQRIIKKRTHVKKRTINPVFNESFVFDVSYNDGLENVSIEFQVLDYDRVTKNEVIGKLELGPKAGSAAQKHWQNVISSPRRQIAEWHKLKD